MDDSIREHRDDYSDDVVGDNNLSTVCLLTIAGTYCHHESADYDEEDCAGTHNHQKEFSYRIEQIRNISCSFGIFLSGRCNVVRIELEGLFCKFRSSSC